MHKRYKKSQADSNTRTYHLKLVYLDQYTSQALLTLYTSADEIRKGY